MQYVHISEDTIWDHNLSALLSGFFHKWVRYSEVSLYKKISPLKCATSKSHCLGDSFRNSLYGSFEKGEAGSFNSYH